MFVNLINIFIQSQQQQRKYEFIILNRLKFSFILFSLKDFPFEHVRA